MEGFSWMPRYYVFCGDEIVALVVVLTIDCVTESNSGGSVTISSN